MKSFSQFKESIIDIPRRAYAPGVFDDEDTDNPKIKDMNKSDLLEKRYKKLQNIGK